MFNKRAFGEMLVEIQGDRSINEYGRNSGVSPAYISKLIRGLNNTAPSPAIIKKLSDRTSEVSYGDLMVAAGHILPLEEDEKLRVKRAYLLKDFPHYRALHPDLDKRFEILTYEEIKELDDFIATATKEEIFEFSQALDNIKDLYVLNQGVEEARALEDKVTETPSNIYQVSQRTVRIPVLGEIACGDPILVEENYEDYRTALEENLPAGDLVYLQAKGDSMHPTIPDGSMVLIRIQEEIENGEIAAVTFNLNAHATLKRVKKQDGLIILMPDNPAHEPTVVTKDNPVRIIGKALRSEQEL